MVVILDNQVIFFFKFQRAIKQWRQLSAIISDLTRNSSSTCKCSGGWVSFSKDSKCSGCHLKLTSVQLRAAMEAYPLTIKGEVASVEQEGSELEWWPGWAGASGTDEASVILFLLVSAVTINHFLIRW